MKVGDAAKKKARVTRLYLEDHPTDGNWSNWLVTIVVPVRCFISHISIATCGITMDNPLNGDLLYITITYCSALSTVNRVSNDAPAGPQTSRESLLQVVGSAWVPHGPGAPLKTLVSSFSPSERMQNHCKPTHFVGRCPMEEPLEYHQSVTLTMWKGFCLGYISHDLENKVGVARRLNSILNPDPNLWKVLSLSFSAFGDLGNTYPWLSLHKYTWSQVFSSESVHGLRSHLWMIYLPWGHLSGHRWRVNSKSSSPRRSGRIEFQSLKYNIF